MTDKHRILLVEDEPDIIAMYELKFTTSGFEFFSASNIATAKQLVHDKQPQLILLDIKIGEENGLDLLKELKANSATKDIPVLLFSNAYQKEFEKLGLELGAKEFLLKSKLLPNEVVAKVRQYL